MTRFLDPFLFCIGELGFHFVSFMLDCDIQRMKTFSRRSLSEQFLFGPPTMLTCRPRTASLDVQSRRSETNRFDNASRCKRHSNPLNFLKVSFKRCLDFTRFSNLLSLLTLKDVFWIIWILSTTEPVLTSIVNHSKLVEIFHKISLFLPPSGNVHVPSWRTYQ